MKSNPEPDEETRILLETRRKRFIRETIGIALGVSVVMIISSLVPQIRENFSLGVVVLWGAAIGGLLASYERFERAGAILTRGENKALNYLVGFGVPIGVMGIAYLIWLN